MIDDEVRRFATTRCFAVLSTMLPSGRIQSQMMWVDADEDHVLINTEAHRQKFRNVERDPRVTVTIFDPADPSHYAEVRGRVVEIVRGPEARAHIDRLSQKYNGRPYAGTIQSERVILKITPDREHLH
jgi:PPOX class probable F420-dependent enzyme